MTSTIFQKVVYHILKLQFQGLFINMVIKMLIVASIF